MPDSHLMLSAMNPTQDSPANDPEKWSLTRPNAPETLGTLWRLRKIAGCVQGGTTKGPGHDYRKIPASHRSRRKPLLSGAAASRHRRFPAHDRAAVRRPREIDPRARRGHEERRPDHARHAEERVGRRSEPG